LSGLGTYHYPWSLENRGHGRNGPRGSSSHEFTRDFGDEIGVYAELFEHVVLVNRDSDWSAFVIHETFG